MPQKFDYNYIKNYIEENSNTILLSKEYNGYKFPLKLQCECGKIFEKSFRQLTTSKVFYCEECRKNKISEKYRLSIEEVKDIIEKHGCEWIDGEYKNSNSKLLLKCYCGNIFEKDLSHFKRQPNCPMCGNENLRKSKIKYSKEMVSEKIREKGYTIIGKYIDARTPFKCKCLKGHEFNIIFSYFLQGHSGCKECANESISGKNNWNYKGGESEVIDKLRKSIKEWKKNVLYSFNYKCPITELNKDLVIHHLYAFSNIVKDSCEHLNLPLLNKINDYNDGEYNLLEQEVIKRHNLNNGIVLNRDIHNKFHSIYGKGNNTPEQFNEFLKNNYNLDLEFIQNKRK